MNNYIKWDIVNSWLSIPTYDESQVLMNVYNALRLINTGQLYKLESCLKKIVDHKLSLPENLTSLISVAYIEDIELNKIKPQPEDYPTLIPSSQQQVTAIFSSLPYSFLTGNYYKKNFVTVKPQRMSYQSKCDSCPKTENECDYTYDINPETNQLIFNEFKSGYACISYYKMAEDKNGELVIPNDAKLIQLIASFVTMKYWEVERQLADYNNYNRCAREFDIAADSFRRNYDTYIGALTSRSLNPKRLAQLSQRKIINLMKSKK